MAEVSGAQDELSTILGAEELNSLSDEIKNKIERILASKTAVIDSLKASHERLKKHDADQHHAEHVDQLIASNSRVEEGSMNLQDAKDKPEEIGSTCLQTDSETDTLHNDATPGNTNKVQIIETFRPVRLSLQRVDVGNTFDDNGRVLVNPDVDLESKIDDDVTDGDEDRSNVRQSNLEMNPAISQERNLIEKCDKNDVDMILECDRDNDDCDEDDNDGDDNGDGDEDDDDEDNDSDDDDEDGEDNDGDDDDDDGDDEDGDDDNDDGDDDEETSSDALQLHAHKQKHQRGQPISSACKLCAQTFRLKGELNAHMVETHPGERPYACDLCPMTFCLENGLRIHSRRHDEQSSYVCAWCSMEFQTQRACDSHARTHYKERLSTRSMSKDVPHKCEYCPKSYVTPGELKKHVLIHTVEGRIHTCPVCLRAYKTNQELKIHMRSHSKKPYVCKMCPKAFSYKLACKVHMKFQHPKEYACSLCPVTFTQNRELVAHLQDTHGGQTLYACHLCERAYTTEISLRNHVKRHTDEKKCLCHVCARAFLTHAELRSHLIVHSDERPLSCTVCSKAFKTHYTLRMHMKVHNPNAHLKVHKPKTTNSCARLKVRKKKQSLKRANTCNICSKTYQIQSRFDKHMEMHREGPFTCTLCQKVFEIKHTFQEHVKNHNREKSHVCDICLLAFKDKSNLKDHAKVHRDEKPFLCDKCSCTFRRRTGLTLHMLTHSSETPHKCHLCPKEFKLKGGLRAHINMHKRNESKERPFKCHLCPKEFMERGVLRRHVKRHNSPMAYCCPVCSQSFHIEVDLTAHMGRHNDLTIHRSKHDSTEEELASSSLNEKKLRETWQEEIMAFQETH